VLSGKITCWIFATENEKNIYGVVQNTGHWPLSQQDAMKYTPACHCTMLIILKILSQTDLAVNL